MCNDRRLWRALYAAALTARRGSLCPERLVRGALAKLGAKVAFTPRGMLIAVFVGLPFVVRAVEPIMREFEIEWEESSATLGASR